MSQRNPKPRRIRLDRGIAPAALVVWIAILVLLAIGVPKLLNRQTESRSDAVAVPAAAAASAPARIDPTPYRERITALERILFKSEPAGYDDTDLISEHAMQLSLAVRATGFKPAHARAQSKIMEFAGIVEMQSDVGYSTPDLADLRARWQTARDAVFEPAPWFRASDDRVMDPR